VNITTEGILNSIKKASEAFSFFYSFYFFGSFLNATNNVNAAFSF